MAAGLAAMGTAGISPVVVEDLIQGMNEWRNIQDIVRVTFKAFHDVLRSQGEAIKSLERVLEGKANRTDVSVALQQRITVSDAHAKFSEVASILASKADSNEVSMELEQRPTRSEMQGALASRASIADVRLATDTRASVDDMANMRSLCERALDTLAADMSRREERIDEISSRLSSKVSRAEMEAAMDGKVGVKDMEERLKTTHNNCRLAMQKCLESKQQHLDLQIASLKEDFSERISREYMRRSEVDELRSVVARELLSTREEVKATASRTESNSEVTAKTIRALSATFDESLAGLRTSLASNSAQFKESIARLGGELSVLQGDMKRGADGVLEGRESLANLRRCLDLKADAAYVKEMLSQKVGTAVFDGALERLENAAVRRDELDAAVVRVLADVDDRIQVALETKAGVAEVNQALSQVNRELDSRVTAPEFQKVIKEQAMVNAAMGAETSVGRWIWRSGKTRAGHLVPWNSQNLNSDPDSLVWEKDKGSILCVPGGLYEISFGFFTRKKPQVQLLINGEPVLAAVNSASYVVHHSSGRLTGVGRHPAGNVTGLTLIDFLALPPRARVSITFLAGNGDVCDDAEGFLAIKKL